MTGISEVERCAICTLPAIHPMAELDEQKVCKACRNKIVQERKQNVFENEAQLIAALAPFKNAGKKYDVVVPLSGGVDSSFALIRIVEVFNLRPLVFHNDHGFEDPVATENVRKLCASLDVDLLLWQHDFNFMKSLWRHLNTSNIPGASACYLCANVIYMNALEITDAFDVPLLINGYSKGQAEIIEQKKRGTDVLAQYLQYISKHDPKFTEQFMAKYRILSRQRIFSGVQDLEAGPTKQILTIPFFLFSFYKTDKVKLQEECRKRFDWQPMKTSYPSRTTNCAMIWLNTYADKRKFGYSVYDEEYAGMVRSGDMSAVQALKDLEYNPPEGMLEKLADEIGYDLNQHYDQKSK